MGNEDSNPPEFLARKRGGHTYCLVQVDGLKKGTHYDLSVTETSDEGAPLAFRLKKRFDPSDAYNKVRNAYHDAFVAAKDEGASLKQVDIRIEQFIEALTENVPHLHPREIHAILLYGSVIATKYARFLGRLREEEIADAGYAPPWCDLKTSLGEHIKRLSSRIPKETWEVIDTKLSETPSTRASSANPDQQLQNKQPEQH